MCEGGPQNLQHQLSVLIRYWSPSCSLSTTPQFIPGISAVSLIVGDTENDFVRIVNGQVSHRSTTESDFNQLFVGRTRSKKIPAPTPWDNLEHQLASRTMSRFLFSHTSTYILATACIHSLPASRHSHASILISG